MRETKQRSVRLDLEDLQKLMAIADRDRLDVSDLIRRAVREFLQREKEAELEKAKVSRLLAGIQRKP
jgi:Arc/MetJ-type ribon-helix-helix transcriptional regulator